MVQDGCISASRYLCSSTTNGKEGVIQKGMALPFKDISWKSHGAP